MLKNKLFKGIASFSLCFRIGISATKLERALFLFFSPAISSLRARLLFEFCILKAATLTESNSCSADLFCNRIIILII